MKVGSLFAGVGGFDLAFERCDFVGRTTGTRTHRVKKDDTEPKDAEKSDGEKQDALPSHDGEPPAELGGRLMSIRSVNRHWCFSRSSSAWLPPPKTS